MARYSTLDNYWYGTQPLAFIAPEQRKLLGNRLGRLVSNIPRLTVLSIAERLRVQAFDGVDISAEWEANDMPQHCGTLFREALLLGAGYVLVSTAPDGSPRLTVESARQVSVERDPASRVVTGALKRWETLTTTEATLFLPDRIVRFSADRKGARADSLRVVDEYANPLGVVPMVPVVNSDRLLDTAGCSEVWDLLPLVDAANKLLVDLMCTSEATGLPRRYATGLQLKDIAVVDDRGEPVLDGNGRPITKPGSPISDDRYKMAVAASPDTKFDQWDAADMSGYESAMRIVMSHIGAISALPPAYLAAWDAQPTSADAVRAQESSLVARVESKQLIFGPALEQVAALVVAVRDGVDPASVAARITWGDPASRSTAQEADAAVKLYQANVLSRAEVLRTLGYSDDQIARIRADLRAEALDGQGVNVASASPIRDATNVVSEAA
ncbi:phage portal protein [Mycolicibacterium sp. J2]|uniref:phage portal protein n=1 Tax=Mycolicibacterium sp. J2 TaxID=2993511 RepID=UPI00224A6A34|nr:phage portal protein [Mycolicibacterium sp. J2]MCX2716082.1 phage portal protein [Mycolicibacterium sp. J2]